ncbi:MAG TPA: hypothetical protein VEO74_11375 [Thermoanaerobaculia bacterium]|nr:hypothetical protein [Thermoanaerobaculia bacterium]
MTGAEDDADVPSFEQELTYYAGVTLDFDGLAKKPLDVGIPWDVGLCRAGRRRSRRRCCAGRHHRTVLKRAAKCEAPFLVRAEERVDAAASPQRVASAFAPQHDVIAGVLGE